MEDKAWLQGQKYRDNDQKVIVVADERIIKIYKNANTAARKFLVGVIVSAAMDNKGDLLAAIKYDDIDSYKVTYQKKNNGSVQIKRADGKEFVLYGLVDYNAKKIDNYIATYKQLQTNAESKENKEVGISINTSSIADNGNVDSAPSIMFCRKCGAKVIKGSRFCSKCGTQL